MADAESQTRRRWAIGFIAGAVTTAAIFGAGWKLSEAVNSLPKSGEIGFIFGLMSMLLIWKATEHIPQHLEKVVGDV